METPQETSEIIVPPTPDPKIVEPEIPKEVDISLPAQIETPKNSSNQEEVPKKSGAETRSRGSISVGGLRPREISQMTKEVIVTEAPEVLNEEEEDIEDDFDDEEFDGISDGDVDDDDTDGLLIPLENGWVCEKRLSDSATNSYSTHFWSPDGQRHSSLTSIKSYGTKKKLKLNMTIFERALKNNPHK